MAKVLRIEDETLCENMKNEARKRGMLYSSFATVCLRTGFQTIKEHSTGEVVDIVPTQEARGGEHLAASPLSSAEGFE